MKTKETIYEILNHATGTENYYRYSPIPGFPVITDGVFMLAEAAGCYWLLDVIGSYQSNRKLDKSFQIWKLTVDTENESAVVQGYNDTMIQRSLSHRRYPTPTSHSKN